MGYLALGAERPEWHGVLRAFFKAPDQPTHLPFPVANLTGFPTETVEAATTQAAKDGRLKAERDLAATAQVTQRLAPAVAANAQAERALPLFFSLFLSTAPAYHRQPHRGLPPQFTAIMLPHTLLYLLYLYK